MATTTLELRHLMEMSNFELFDFDYTFDDYSFKKKLEQQVIDFYYFYEIGQETPDAFKHRFKTRWLRLIDYYNELYNTTLLEYNPLVNYSMKEALDQLSSSNNRANSSSNGSGTTSGTSSSDSDTNTKNSDYPQQPIAGGDFLAGEADSTTSTNSSDSGTNTNKMSSTTSGDSSSNTNYKKTVEGLTGTSYQELITKQRQALIRIPPMIIEEMKPCFILVH